MEANLFIKSYKAEGNKIKDIQFYGDWEIGVGESTGGTATRKAIKGLPDTVNAYVEGDRLIIENNNETSVSISTYILYRSNYNLTGHYGTFSDFPVSSVGKGGKLRIAIPEDTKNYGEQFIIVAIRQYPNMVGLIKAGYRNGVPFVEGV